jgi:hypothetical protein
MLIFGVENDSPHFDDLKRLMVILEVNEQAVDSLESVEENLIEGEQNRFYVWAEGTMRFVVLRL